MNERIQTPKETIRPNQEQAETLSQSLTQRVKEALEKIRSRVKAYLEKGQIQKHLEYREYEKIYEMIEEYPEDIRERIRERVDQELMSNPDILVNRFLDKALAERDKFLYSTDEKGERKLKIEGQKVIDIFRNILKEKNISLLIKNLDIFFDLKKSEQSKSDLKYLVNNLEIEIRDLILSSDENVIQEALKTASPEVRKLYEDNFEKKYLKKEYIDKAIVGAREKGEKAETEEEKEKYRRVVEGLEYLRDYEKNVREHCKKMFEQYGIFEEDTVNYMLELIDEYLKQSNILKNLGELAAKQNLNILEYLGLLQSQTIEVIGDYRLYSVRNEDELKHILTGKGNNDRDRPNFRRFISQSERTELGIGNVIGTGSTKELYEEGHFGKKYIEKNHGSRNVTYGFLNPPEQHTENSSTILYRSGWGFRLELKDKVKDRATFTKSGGRNSREDMLQSGNITSWVRFPHVATLVSLVVEIKETKGVINRNLKRLIMSKRADVNDDVYNSLEVQYHGETGSADQIQTIMYHHERPEEGEVLRRWVAECDIPNDIKIESDKERHHSRKRN